MDEEASNLSTFDIYSDLLLEQQTPGVHVSVDQVSVYMYKLHVLYPRQAWNFIFERARSFSVYILKYLGTF